MIPKEVIAIWLKAIENCLIDKNTSDAKFEIKDGQRTINIMGRPSVQEFNGTQTITIEINGGAINE